MLNISWEITHRFINTPTHFTVMECCTPSPQPKPTKTCKKSCVAPPLTGWDPWNKASDLWWPCPDGCFTQQMINLQLHLYTFLFPWSPQIFKLSSKYLCASQEHHKCGSPMQFQLLAVPQGLQMTAWEAASDCTVLTFHPLLPWICGAGSTFSCPGSLGLGFYGKHLETNMMQDPVSLEILVRISPHTHDLPIYCS